LRTQYGERQPVPARVQIGSLFAFFVILYDDGGRT